VFHNILGANGDNIQWLAITRFAPRHAWSLEMKWVVVKHGVAKILFYFSIVDRLKELDTMSENLVEKALVLYQDKINSNFTYLHCWQILWEVPPWAGLREERRIPPMKKMCPILNRWEGENYAGGGETLLPPSLNE
jgi:hypothetical protein